MTEFLYLSPREFLHDSFRLGKAIEESGFRPRHVVSVWRGGTPVGLGVDAYFRTRGLFLDHTTIATESYTGVQQQGQVQVKGLEHLVDVVCREDGLLIVDDVLESGNTIQAILRELRRRARANTPEDIRVAAIHHKPEKTRLEEHLPVIKLHDVAADVWIAYPHELSDLVREDDPDDQRIRDKDPELWELLRGKDAGSSAPDSGDYFAVTPRELLLDSVRLGVQLARDKEFQPDFLVALWPGGVNAGLPVHEVYRYFWKKGWLDKVPDHISLNTRRTRNSARADVIGIEHLVEHIGKSDNVLILDTAFGSGQLVNNVVTRLKEALRRNLDLDRLRVAAVYFNPKDRLTWTVPRTWTHPDFYVKRIESEVIYPHSVPKIPRPRQHLREHDPVLFELLYGAETGD